MTFQSFLTGMMKADDGKLANADIEALARKHGVPVDWAKMTLGRWLGRQR